MNEQHFTLVPFPCTNLPDLKIIGTIARQNNILIIKYNLLGNLADVVIPIPSEKPLRKHELWQETCFEFFLSIKNSPRYWEFNLSSDGNWNVYRFSDYRQEMQEETVFKSLPFDVEIQSNNLSLILNLDLDPIISVAQSLEVAITTVIKQSNEEVTYWALTHQGEEADFHRRDGFMIELI